ncbi:MAG: hypothetical protein GFH23_1086674n67 [Chloroflexi bacterium AL-N1]|nr:hypothetical protein [Chloroflexi bacterium AL-N1]NOK92212.1 hypothetical protein [Chloroflexi bacterium AL-N15]
MKRPEEDVLDPCVRRVMLGHDELRQSIETYLGYQLPDDTNFHALRNCYGDGQVHMFIESQEFPPTLEATMLMQHVPVLQPQRRR